MPRARARAGPGQRRSPKLWQPHVLWCPVSCSTLALTTIPRVTLVLGTDRGSGTPNPSQHPAHPPPEVPEQHRVPAAVAGQTPHWGPARPRHPG